MRALGNASRIHSQRAMCSGWARLISPAVNRNLNWNRTTQPELVTPVYGRPAPPSPHCTASERRIPG